LARPARGLPERLHACEAPTARRTPNRNRYSAAALRRHAALLRAQAIEAGRRARRQLLLLIPLLVALTLAYEFRRQLFGADGSVRLAIAGALIVLGWALARDVADAFQPQLVRRVDPGTAGVAAFVIRLFTLAVIVLVSLRVAGLNPGTLALGASLGAVILGLAAQQTFGNLFAGVVLVSARPFEIGDRVRFNGFGMDVEGTVAAHGLLYVTLTDGDDLVLVPNNTALAMSIRPLRQPAAVDMRARLPVGTDPQAIERRLASAVTVPLKGPPQIVLEEFDGDDIVVRVRATPSDRREGGRLAREVIDAIAEMHRDPLAAVDGEPARRVD
jgi:small-conductance mechanosensitive channel